MKKQLNKLLSVLLIIMIIVIALPYADTQVNAASNIYETTWKDYNLGSTNKGVYLEPAEDGQYPVLIFVHGMGGPSDIPKDTLRNLIEYWTEMGYMDKMVIILPTIEQGTAPSIFEAFRYWGQNSTGSGLLGKKIKDGAFSSFQGLYLGEKLWGWFNYASELTFDDGADLFASYGNGEVTKQEPNFKTVSERFVNAFKANNN